MAALHLYEDALFGEKAGSLSTLRRLVLKTPLPLESEAEQDARVEEGGCSTRGFLWKVLLGVSNVDAEMYINLVKKGPSSQHDKIINDTCRTLRGNKRFEKNVTEDSLIRVLNAFVHFVGDKSDCTYVQGLNVVAAPFLYTMPEVDAFFAFTKLVLHHIPLYTEKRIIGAYRGCDLFDDVLKAVDSQLASHLQQRSHQGRIFALKPILSLGAGIPPLDQLLRIWDFLFAFGPHLIVLCTVAHVRKLRDDLLKTDKPNEHTRTLPDWDAEYVINEAHRIAKLVPPSLYEKIVRHTFEEASSVDDSQVGVSRLSLKGSVKNKTWAGGK
eukprot:CAMPEP_0113877662 /NCGR_PEP_ID=MMETSP0780_2-20120614/6227_1 /TAXON_ID=652834 /ORGANISM="Palpitomonas bilix" /LENGTH=325 /DNA_ID=CAMNT_0000863997 /DNA_START=57 /DNA_END=1034 /DNA_ORIENTATION=+ /assembly_acc=CAM_ASM_000599